MFEIAGGIIIAVLILGLLSSEGMAESIGKLFLYFFLAVLIVFAVWQWEFALIASAIIVPIYYFGRRRMDEREKKRKIYEATSLDFNLSEIKSKAGELLLSDTAEIKGRRIRKIKVSEKLSLTVNFDSSAEKYHLYVTLEEKSTNFEFEKEVYQDNHHLAWFPENLTVDEVLLIDQELKDFVGYRLPILLKEAENSPHTEENFFEDTKILCLEPKIILLQHFIPQDGIDVDEVVMCNERILLEAESDLENQKMKIYKDGMRIGKISIKKWNELRKAKQIILQQ